jgi:serine-type D-Ala-D-Ala carboxypeptidase/endopeptidase
MHIRTLALAATMAAMVSTTTQAEEAAGAWMGVMKTSALGDLTMALRLHKVGTAYEGEIDDVTLGARHMAVKNVEATADRLTFDVPIARGRYEAIWDAAANQWAGTWKSPGVDAGVALRLAHGAPPPPPHVEGLDGDWQGTINYGVAGLLRLVFHIRTGPDGATTATGDSPDQGVFGGPISGVRRHGRDVEIESLSERYLITGELSDDGSRIQGEFTLGPNLAPLVLIRGGDLPAASAVAPSIGPTPTVWRLPDDAAVRQILARRIDTERRGVGIVVGMISPAGRRVVAYGAPETGDPRRVDGETLFEIGSISKTFTALALQDMALKGEVGLDDPVAKYLPPGTKVPSHGGKEITLRELATHTAALPHDMPNPAAKRQEDTFDHMTEADLDRFLATYQLPRDPGAEWEYSNLGVGLLGVALSHRAGVNLETLVHQRVTGPLGMTSTVYAMTPALAPRLAVGHDAFLRPEPPFNMGVAEQAAGQIRSSADDMLKLLAAEMGYTRTPLKPAMDAMLATERPGMDGGFKQALGWMILDAPSGRIVTHSGGTFGQRAFAAFNPKTREGVIVLSNAEGANGADDIGLYIISGVPIRPLAPAPPAPSKGIQRPELALSAEAAKPYLGRYQLSRSLFMTLGYDAGHLTVMVEATGRKGAPQPVAWHGENDFTAPNGGGDTAQMTFQMAPSNQASAFTWRGPAGEFLLRRVKSIQP